MYSFSDILARLKDGIQTKETLIEGFFTMSNLRTVAKEFALTHARIDDVESNYALSSARGAFLDARAEDYGITRREATFAEGKIFVVGKEGTLVDGVFSTTAGVEVEVTTPMRIEKEAIQVPVRVLEVGSAGNLPAGTTWVVPKGRGITEVYQNNPFYGGADREDDATLRARIYEKIRHPVTSGNVNHYKVWARSVAGVGKVKVYPLWKGPGTVRVVLLGLSGRAADSSVVTKVQNYIDPSKGKGEGVAPVGAVVTVEAAKETPMVIKATLTLDSTYEAAAIYATLRYELKEYFASVAFVEKNTQISLAQVGHLLMRVPGVKDYKDLTLNGKTESVLIADDAVAVLSKTDFNGTVEEEWKHEEMAKVIPTR